MQKNMPAKGGSASGGKTKKKIAVLAVLLLAFFFAGSARADYWVRYNSTNSGLPANSWVSKIVKDSRGAKWVYGYANSGGFIYMFDGAWHDYSSTFFDYAGSSWNIHDMYANNSGDVWFCTGNWQLIHFDGSNWSEYSYDNSQSIVEQLYTGHTVISGSVQIYSVFGDPAGSSTYSLAYVSGMVDGQSISGNYKVLKRNGSGVWSIAINEGSLLTAGNAFALSGSVSPTNGDIWFRLTNSTGAGIYRYNGSWTRYTSSNGLVSNNLSDAYIDSSGNVWAATDRGVSKFNGSSWESWTTDNSNLATNIVTSVDGDSDGKIWFVSTYNSDTSTMGGTSTYSPSDGSWSYYSIRNGDDNFGSAQYIFVLGDEMWATVGNSGVLALTKDDSHTTVYGQVNGQTVDRAAYSELKKKKSKVKSRKVTILQRSRVLKKKKWKWVTRKVYSTKTSDWYKMINLETGQYTVKVQGKRTKTVDITSGEPYRLNF
jgi:hypothetical protein